MACCWCGLSAGKGGGGCADETCCLSAGIGAWKSDEGEAGAKFGAPPANDAGPAGNGAGGFLSGA